MTSTALATAGCALSELVGASLELVGASSELVGVEGVVAWVFWALCLISGGSWGLGVLGFLVSALWLRFGAR